jgi:hypothetical protein
MEPGTSDSTRIKRREVKRFPLTKEELDFLQDVSEHPFDTTRQRNKRLGLSAWKGNRLRSGLASKGIFTIIPVNRGGRGGRFHLIQFTEFGRDVLASYGMTLALGYGRGGIEHQWWAQTITEWLQSNHYESAIEDESMGARVDIGVNAGSLGQVAIEIEISLGNEAHNIRKDLEAGYSAVISLVKERAQLSRLRSLLPVDFPNADVHIGLLPDFSHILSRILEGTSARTPPNQNQEPKNDSPETAPEDPSTPEQHEPAPPQTSQSAPVDVEALLEAVVAGGNLLRRGQGGTKPRRRVPMKQERLLRLLSIYGAVSLDHAIEEFADEWNRIHARRSGDVAKREFFRNMADLASRINDAFAAIRQEQEPGNNTASLQNATFAVIEIKYQSYSLELRFNPEHGGTDPGDGPSPAPPRSVANKNLEDLS